MKRIEFTTKGEARKIQRLIDKAMGLPKPGVNICGGYYPPTVTGTAEWTDIKRRVKQTRDGNGRVTSVARLDVWVLICDDNIRAIAKDDTAMANLNKSQCDLLNAAIAAQIDANDDADDMEADNGGP